MSNKIKKEDRGFLYFRENEKGGLNIKFGPDKYGHDTEKFSQILMIGVLKCIAFLSGLTSKEPLDIRMAQYENIKVSFSAIFDEAFPDVFEEKKRLLGLENLAIERAEAGDPLPQEYLDKIEKAKEQIKQRSTQRTPEKIEADQENFKKDVEDKIQTLQETKEHFQELHPEFEDDENEKNFIAKQVINKLIDEEIKKLEELYGEIELGLVKIV